MNTTQKRERHNTKLRELGIPYQALDFRGGTNPRSLYCCDKGHEFDADRARIVSGKAKCPTCEPGPGRAMTHEAYEDRLIRLESPFYPLEPYAGSHTKIKHGCINGHEHEIEPSTVLRNVQGCPYCSGMKKKTTESYKAELLGKEIRYWPLEEYVNASTKIDHKCDFCGHIWKVMPTEILKGSGCPSCASFGFNRAKPATLYYVKLWDEYRTYYKIGVTNGSVDRRFRNCGKQYKILLEQKHDTGREAEAREKMVLEEYKDYRALAPKWLKTGGNTELFKHDVLLLDVDSLSPFGYNGLNKGERNG